VNHLPEVVTLAGFICFYFLLHPREPTLPLFPYTTLFRSRAEPASGCEGAWKHSVRNRFARRVSNRQADLGPARPLRSGPDGLKQDRKSTRLNSSHVAISYAVFCL